MKKPSVSPHRHLFLLLGSGGVGKTWFARMFVAFLMMLGIKLRVVDGDEPSKKDLLRFFPGESEFQDLSRRDQIVTFFNEVVSGTDDVVLVDAKADRQSEFRASKLFSPRIVTGWATRERLKVTIIIPVVANKHSSMVVPLDWFGIFGPSANYILALNEVGGPIDLKKAPVELQEFIRQAKPAVIRLQALSPEIAREMDLYEQKHQDVIRLGDLEFSKVSNEYSFSLAGTHAIAEVEDDWEHFRAQVEPIIKNLLENSDETPSK